MARPKQSFRKKLFLCFFVIIAINLIGEGVIYYHNELLSEFADEAEDDIAAQARIDAYLGGMREISTGLFMIASGRVDMGRRVVHEADAALRDIEQYFEDVDWAHFIADKQDFLHCVSLKRDLLGEVDQVADLIGETDSGSEPWTTEQRAQHHARLEAALGDVRCRVEVIGVRKLRVLRCVGVASAVVVAAAGMILWFGASLFGGAAEEPGEKALPSVASEEEGAAPDAVIAVSEAFTGAVTGSNGTGRNGETSAACEPAPAPGTAAELGADSTLATRR